MGTRDPRIDAYIAKAQPFAKPILEHIREIVHAACPATEETMKWSSPHFDYGGQMMCGMVAFKAHAALGFWKASMIEGLGPGSGAGARGSLGKLTSIKDLPSKQLLTRYIRSAMKLNDEGVVVKRAKTAPKKPAAIPKELADALRKDKKAQAEFEKFPPGQRREYCDWIADAKREETRAKRVAQAVEWISEGKIRNWKYL